MVGRLLLGCVYAPAVQGTGWVLHAFFQIPSTRETSIQKSRNLTYYYRFISLIKRIVQSFFLSERQLPKTTWRPRLRNRTGARSLLHAKAILPIQTMSKATSQRIVVFSGGSATNNLVDVFNTLIERKKCGLTYVIPISDNGGSSSELIRVFGGPGQTFICS